MLTRRGKVARVRPLVATLFGSLALVPAPVLAVEAEQKAPSTAPELPAEKDDPAAPRDETPSTSGEPEPTSVEPDKAWETAPADHRGGFAIGLLASAGLGASNGYPADAKKIGRLAFYTESGLGFMGAAGGWLGGALADWLTFGVGGGYTVIVNGDTFSPAPFAFFHADIYPLYGLGGALRNLGVMADFGLGFPTTEDSETEETLIDGTGASFIQAGIFWEGIEAWKLKMGPYIATHYMFSETIRRPSGVLGFRISLYTHP